MKKNIIFYFVLFIATNISAQHIQLKFEHLSVTEGLSQSSVSSVAEDEHGFMWFSTLDALNKFDGYKITKYYEDSTEGGLPDNIINYVYSTPDETKQLWIGTADNGLCLYDPIFDKFIQYSHKKNPNTLIDDHVNCIVGNKDILWIGTQEGLSMFDRVNNRWKNFDANNSDLKSVNISTLKFDAQGDLWVGTRKGLYRIDTSTFIIDFFNTESGLPSDIILSLALANDESFWVGTSNGLVRFNPVKGNFEKFEASNQLPDQQINALLFDYQGIMWIGTQQAGLVRYDFSTGQMNVFQYDPTDPSSISVNTILFLYEDSKHILWVGTSLGGVDKWNRVALNLLVFRHNPYNPYSLSSSRVRSIYEDNNGIVWIGTVDGGLNKWDPEKLKFIHTQFSSLDQKSIPDNHIRAIIKDSKGRFWIGTANSGLVIIDQKTMKVKQKFINNPDDSTTISSNKIWRIVEDKNGTLWIATYGGGVNYLDNDNYIFKSIRKNTDAKNSLSNDFCTNIFADSRGKIWIGTIEGLNMYDPKTNKNTIFIHNPNDTNSICNNRIYSIIEDSDGEIWVGTKGGLSRYLGNNHFQNFTVKNTDIPNNVIMGMLEDSEQNIWLTTNQGLCKFNRVTHKAKTYDVKDGLQSNEFLVGSYFKTKKGMFLIGGINGFNAFYPEKIKINPNKPYIVITDLMVSNQKFYTDTNITEKKYLKLTYKQNDLTFSFVAIDYILPEKNQYAYKLEGYDQEWIYSKYLRIARYTNLPPGHYTFRVIGSNNDGIWNKEGTFIHIYIKPAFWQTLAFKIGLGILILALAFTFYKVRMRMLKIQKKKLEEEVKRQTKEIREKNEEITIQNSVLIQQKEEIQTQRDQIEEQHKIAIAQRDLIALHKKEIEDSIIYAKNIQTAALPENKLIQLLFNEFFILFMPRDIVSGDFYWASQKKGKIIAVAADCTGHGVPGAFMSMLGISFLNKIVNEKEILEPNIILDSLRANIVKALKQSVDGVTKDGMDISVCVIDNKKQTLEFASANNSMYMIRNNELTEIEADSMPVAIYDNMKPFNKIVINIEPDDVFYMFSDGYADQFGGPKSKKFKYSNLKKLFLKIHKMPMQEQKKYLNDTIVKWMNFPDKYTGEDKHFQIDDILIFGIRV